jgi:transcription termination/antitermination protein NusG
MSILQYQFEPMTIVVPAVVPCWYAVQTKSRFEKVVHAELQMKGFESYLPLSQETHVWKDRKKTVEVPLFSGYVFARLADVAAERVRVAQTHGVARILGNGTAIYPIDEKEIAAVQCLVAARAHTPHPHLREGVRVRVRRGPLTDVEGFLVRVKNATRLVISINLIAQSVATEIDIDDVTVLPA